MTRSSSSRSQGQSLVEFALVLPLLLVVLFGILDFGRVIYAYNAISNAARTGARVAIVDQTESAIEAAARSEAVGIAPMTVTVTYPDCSAADLKLTCTVSVEVSHQWQPVTPVIGAIVGPITVRSTTSMSVERVYQTP
jgi:Flp pilus assembly protein TadG